MTPRALRECLGCGQFQIMPELGPGMRSSCVRCGTTLRRNCIDSIDRSLALNLAAVALFVVVWTGMLMKVSTAGIVHETTLTSGPIELVRQGLWPLALAVGFTTALAPLGKFGCMIYVLTAVRFDVRLPKLPQVFLFGQKLGIWAMLEVLLLGVFVAYTKLGDLVSMNVGPAVFALGGLTIVVIWADLALDPDAVWDGFEQRGWTHAPMPPPDPGKAIEFHADLLSGAIGCEGCGRVDVPEAEEAGEHRHCPRCGSALHPRKPDSLNRTWAFILSGAILYIPANYYPVLTVIQAGAGQPSTIMGGVEELVDSRMYPLALLVFFASILVPVFKLIGLAVMLMATMLVTTELGASFLLPQRTRLYYVVAWIGRWSMVDIFMESLLGALVQFGTLVTIAPGIGAIAFCAVVLVTIFGAEAFDPRLMWDAAGRNPHVAETPLRRWSLKRDRA
ncbi:MAG: paraquat-inducible protein A, partial [Alphaproteobacteria bacterium]|nr:paraquat-inducible protein A [Alphaproteobacteria bacterium]